MVYFWKKNGKVIWHTAENQESAMSIAERLSGITSQPVMQMGNEEFEAGGNLARIVSGEIFIGKTDAERQAETNSARIVELKKMLADTDYIAAKIAEGSATTQQYASQIAERQAWRSEIEQLQAA